MSPDRQARVSAIAPAMLDYDPETGVFTWRVSPANCIPAGSRAGTINMHGYRQIGVRGVIVRAARLAWLFAHGRWPSGVIDHIDGDRLNDRIANLREASYAENARNSRGHSGRMKGVTFSKNGWQASICVDRRRMYLGRFKTEEAAHAAYMQAARLHHQEFACDRT